LFTRNGKSITIKGVKPVCPFIQDFKNTYLFGAFSHITGSSLLLDMPYCNTECFEISLLIVLNLTLLKKYGHS
jgi:hypothetical protein